MDTVASPPRAPGRPSFQSIRERNARKAARLALQQIQNPPATQQPDLTTQPPVTQPMTPPNDPPPLPTTLDRFFRTQTNRYKSYNLDFKLV